MALLSPVFDHIVIDVRDRIDEAMRCCEHLTLDLVWRPEWQTHPNGAGAVARVVVTTGDPRRTAQLFRGLFGGDAMAEREGRWVMAAGSAQVELAPPNMIAADGSHFCKTRRAVDRWAQPFSPPIRRAAGCRQSAPISTWTSCSLRRVHG
jgi:hypothetical protein